MRSYNDKNSRAIAVSNNGGSSWSEIKHDLSLVESRCQQVLLIMVFTIIITFIFF